MDGKEDEVGSNRRYPRLLERNIENAIAKKENPAPEACSLSEDELDKKNQSLRRADKPIPVRVWVHFSDGSVIRIEKASAVAYTSKTVFVEAEYEGRKFGVWVWANAVERVIPRELNSV